MKKQARLRERTLSPWKLAELPQTETVLLGLSGGADSRALLHLLSEQARRDGFSVVTAHVNHGIRGDEADRDAAFCKRLAELYGWEFLSLKADVPALAKENGRSLELEAREVRYAFFRQIMAKRNIRILATAHHADDNLETVLFRICRGTGLHGLVGISASRPFANGMLVRPLLPFSKREILAFCREEGLEFVIDSTNECADCSRNQIRLEVIPPLENRFPSVQNNVYRMTKGLSDDQDFLEREAAAFFESHFRKGGISAACLQEAHPAIRRRVIGKMFPKSAEFVHLEAVEELLQKNSSGASVSLPGDMCACLQNGRLLALPDLRRTADYEAFPLAEGEKLLCDGRLLVSVSPYDGPCETECLDRDVYESVCVLNQKTAEGLCFRHRRDGDVMLRHGVKRQVRRLYREAGVPTAVRDGLPLLCAGNTVLWTPFVGWADDALTTTGETGDWLVRVRLLSSLGQ